MRSFLFLFILALVLAVSGCVSETGELIINFTETAPEEENMTIPEEPPSEENAAMDNVTGNITEQTQDNITHDPCAGKICDDSISTCPDGEVVTCENTCDPETGECSSCIPDCTGHNLPEEDACELVCGDCEEPDEESCECITLLYCDGNGICEPSNEEWPSGSDCAGFNGCDDEDSCTQDIFNPNQQRCVHTDICCDDEDDCTVDFFNYTTEECYHSYVCCGNGICEPGNGETEENCPEDCFEEEEAPGDVVILGIDAVDEIVILEGYGIDLTNWTLEDAGPNFIYQFPDNYIIDGKTYLYRGYGDYNSTHLFWQSNSYVWNNNGDTATLRNDTGEIVHTFTYP